MHEVVSTSGTIPPGPVSSENVNVGRCVESQERLESFVPKAVYAIVLGLPTASTILQGRGWLDIILQAVVLFFVAKLFVWALRSIFLLPTRAVRYNGAAKNLRKRLQAGESIAVGPFSWTLGAPGAMGMTRSGKIIILDREHDYVPLELLPHQIADVKVECNSQQYIETSHSGRTSIGGFGKSFGLGYTMGGRSTSVSRTVNEYFLDIRYQLEKNGPVETVVVPGGSERRVVEELCATIKRLEA